MAGGGGGCGGKSVETHVTAKAWPGLDISGPSLGLDHIPRLDHFPGLDHFPRLDQARKVDQARKITVKS